MTDEAIDQNPTTAQAVDELLQLLVACAREGVALPMTLYVKGTIVSGKLIGQHRFLTQWVEQFSSWMGDEARETMRNAFGLDEPEPDYKDMDASDIRFIHLEEAKVFTPGQNPLPSNGMLWRGRLTEVDGFSYGTFEVAE